MMERKIVILPLVVLVALALVAFTATSRAQDAERTVELSAGCNMTTLTFADGTEAATVAAAVSPPDALETIWRLDNASGSFQAFTPQAPQASDLLSVNLLDAVFICLDANADISMPSVSPDPSGTPLSTDLSSGCNPIGLTYPDGTAPSQVAGAITPPDVFESIWRLDNATGTFQAYVAAAPQASDLTSLQFLDAVFLCMAGPGSVTMPALTGPPSVARPEPLEVFVGVRCVVFLPTGKPQLTITVRAETAENISIKRVKVVVAGTTQLDSGDISDQNLRTFERSVGVHVEYGTHAIKVTVEATGGVKPVHRTGTATLGKNRCSAHID